MILDCKELIERYTGEIKEAVNSLDKKPTLAIVRVGNDDASKVYVGLKEKKCEEVGIRSEVIHLEENETEKEVISMINRLNCTEHISGVLVQLPLPKHLNERAILDSIAPHKDVDGLSLLNVGALNAGEQAVCIPCTPMGIMSIFRYNGIPVEGRKVLIINRSNIVGKPLAQMMLAENALVSIAHSKVSKKLLNEEIKQADIIITGVGIPNFIGEKYKPFKKQVIIDVSMNRDKDGKLCGDVSKKLYTNDKLLITPVPGSVGPMTVLSLLDNTYQSYARRLNSFTQTD